MGKEYLIRRAEAKDIPGVLRLLEQVDMVHHRIRPDLFMGPATKYGAEELRGMLRDDDNPIFVCTDEKERVLGHCFCCMQRQAPSAVLKTINTLYIDDLCVDENERGKHIGKALYDHVLAYAKENGCYNITLNVWAGNDAAQRFYERLGLKPQKIGMEMIL